MGKNTERTRNQLTKTENAQQDIIDQIDQIMLRAQDENQALRQIFRQVGHDEFKIFDNKNKIDKMELVHAQELVVRKRLSLKSFLQKAETGTKTEQKFSQAGSINELIVEEVGELALQFIGENTNFLDEKTYVSSTTTRFNIDQLPGNRYDNIVNLKRINDIRRINKFFESVNDRIPEGGIYIDNVETYVTRKSRILKKFVFPLNWLMYTIDVFITRVLPKIPITKNLYFFLTRGKGRVLSKAETFGRLYSCGFEIVEEKFIGNLLYFAARKKKEPAYDKNPTYGPLISLKRYGKDSKLFNVYKLRTMHAYSEYLQEYIFQKNHLQEGGKFKNDFRITSEGKFFRKFWIDELPMFINLLRGDMKMVGVRPLSSQYFNLYSKELKEKRSKHKPGLIPPFYADLPKTLDEIMASEMHYLEEHEKHPIKTDIKYFLKAWQNILFKKARSN